MHELLPGHVGPVGRALAASMGRGVGSLRDRSRRMTQEVPGGAKRTQEDETQARQALSQKDAMRMS